MTLPVLETSRSDSKPVELWRFAIDPKPSEAAGEMSFFTDAMSYADQPAAAAAGWATNAVLNVPVTWTPAGVIFNVTGSGSGSSVSKTVPVPAGAAVALEYTYEAHGPWWQPLGGTITSGGNLVTADANPAFTAPFTGTRRTPFMIAAASEVTITFRVAPIFTTGNDLYTITNARLIIVEDGSSIELPATTLYFARGERDFTFQGNLYLKSAFNRNVIRSGAGEGLEQIELRMPRSHPVAQLFRRGPPIAPVEVTVFHVHRQDLVAGDSFTTPFVGQVGQAVFENAECVLTLESMRVLLGYKSPHLLVQLKCANFLYDRQCGLDRESHKYSDGVVAFIDGFSLEITGLSAAAGATDPKKFEFGFIIAPSGEHCFIEAQDGDGVTLLAPPQYISLGDNVTVYWGCDRTAQVCHSRFSNIVNHNGRALMPRKNHWTGVGLNI